MPLSVQDERVVSQWLSALELSQVASDRCSALLLPCFLVTVFHHDAVSRVSRVYPHWNADAHLCVQLSVQKLLPCRLPCRGKNGGGRYITSA